MIHQLNSCKPRTKREHHELENVTKHADFLPSGIGYIRRGRGAFLRRKMEFRPLPVGAGGPTNPPDRFRPGTTKPENPCIGREQIEHIRQGRDALLHRQEESRHHPIGAADLRILWTDSGPKSRSPYLPAARRVGSRGQTHKRTFRRPEDHLGTTRRPGNDPAYRETRNRTYRT